MTSTSVLPSLIERLERATGPDRELDLAIHRAVRRCKPTHTELRYERVAPFDALENLSQVFVDSDVHESGYCLGVRRINYTASIDAALTTLEPGWEYEISTLYGIAAVTLPLNDTGISPVHSRNDAGNVAAAITAASLKAREATGDRHEG